MLQRISYKIPFCFIFFLIIISTVYATSPSYDTTNRFWEFLKDPLKNLDTKIFTNTKYTLAFEDQRKQTKEHILFIPKGKYSSFIDFVDKGSPEEMTDFFKTIVEVTEKLSLDKWGYRLITNHSLTPGKKTNNDASQEVPHFHVHLAGGECLGLPVVGAVDSHQSREKINMSISNPPFGFDFTAERFLQYVSQNTFSQLIFQDAKNGLRKIIAYNLPVKDLHLKSYMGFILLNAKGESAYTSIQDLLQSGTTTELTNVLKFISSIIKKTPLYQTGFRLIVNEGKDGWQSPQDIFQIIVAGGVKMGMTVTNAQGNRKPKSKDEPGDISYPYEDLKTLPHVHCSESKRSTLR